MNSIRMIGSLVILCSVMNVEASGNYPDVPLPPLAKAGVVDDEGDRWNQSGEISGSVAKVHGEFSAVMSKRGWVLQKTINIGKIRRRSELMLWSKGNHRILMMIWEKNAGLCGFSWGVEA